MTAACDIRYCTGDAWFQIKVMSSLLLTWGCCHLKAQVSSFVQIGTCTCITSTPHIYYFNKNVLNDKFSLVTTKTITVFVSIEDILVYIFAIYYRDGLCICFPPSFDITRILKPVH